MLITIARVGVRANDLTLEVARALETERNIILHTRRCGCADWLEENGIPFASLDHVYEQAEDFDAHARMAAQAVLACGEASALYCVMSLYDESVKYLMESGERMRVLGGGCEGELLARARGATLIMCSTDLGAAVISADNNTLAYEIDSRALAGEVKLRLLKHYPEETQVYFKVANGGVARMKLYEIDRLKEYDHTCACLAPSQRDLTRLERFDFGQLMRLTEALCDPATGCPWDRAQTHDSLKRYTVEEAYEVQDAIESGDCNNIAEELGDLLFTAALQIRIGVAHGEFDAGDVLGGVARKMISRHSHVFGNDSADTPSALSAIWNTAKMREKGLNSTADEMRAVAKGLPALMRAQKVIKKAARAGDERAVSSLCDLAKPLINDKTREDELGDALLRLAGWAHSRGFDAEKALEDAVGRWISRYDAREL